MSLKVGYVPEHFSTPLFFAKEQGYYAAENLTIDFVPFPSGSGHLIQCLGDKSIDVAIGLTEAFVAGIGKGNKTYKLVGTYVQSPLCWAISTGADRSDINNEDDLKGKKIGVSRIGSGSYVMSFVLAHNKKWLGSGSSSGFEDFVVLHNFQNLRNSVNLKEDSEKSDAFMWEHFTSKKYYDNGEIKRIGEIYTPWPSWAITARTEIADEKKQLLEGFFRAVNKGIGYFNAHKDEAIKYISTNLDYNAEDAAAWMKTVEFVKDTSIVEQSVVEKTTDILIAAGVVPKQT